MLEPVKLLNNASFSSKNVPSNSFLMGQPRPLLSFIFGLFKQTSLRFLQQIYVKNSIPQPSEQSVLRFELFNMSLLP